MRNNSSLANPGIRAASISPRSPAALSRSAIVFAALRRRNIQTAISILPPRRKIAIGRDRAFAEVPSSMHYASTPIASRDGGLSASSPLPSTPSRDTRISGKFQTPARESPRRGSAGTTVVRVWDPMVQ